MKCFGKRMGRHLMWNTFPTLKLKNGEIVGIVVTFMDISERKKKEAAIEYLSCYDTLRFSIIVVASKKIEKIWNSRKTYLPVIFDING